MNDLLVLVKILSALYQAKKLKDNNLINELVETLEELPKPNPDVFQQDKETRESIRATIQWLLKQPNDEPIIKSLLMQRVELFCKNDDALKKTIEAGLEDCADDEMTRKLVYKHVTEVRMNGETEAFAKKFKSAIRDFYFKELHEMKKEDWGNLVDMIQERINATYEERQSEIVHTITSDAPESFYDVIEMAKKENSKEGILKTGLQGINEGLEPDGGFRRSKMYLVNALTNRGKSLTMAHFLASVGMYNKPLLRKAVKIPTLLMESSEDTMDLIVMRMYKLATESKAQYDKSFQTSEKEDIVDTIVSCFKENGWYLIVNQIEANKDSMQHIFDRVRALEMKGHEIIWYGYDYLGLVPIDKIPGESKSDKLQILFRRVRSFMIARGICFVTPHQLSPEAKKMLKEADDESEVYFAREAAGKSLTETSTKITNEVDVEITIHVAKTNTRNYWTFCIGKQRGEGCAPNKRFGIYDIDPVYGLQHDIHTKPKYRRSLQQKFSENGELVSDFDHL
jgi:hypothetical protein